MRCWKQLDLLVCLPGDLIEAHGADQPPSSRLKHIRTLRPSTAVAKQIIPQSAQWHARCTHTYTLALTHTHTKVSVKKHLSLQLSAYLAQPCQCSPMWAQRQHGVLCWADQFADSHTASMFPQCYSNTKGAGKGDNEGHCLFLLLRKRHTKDMPMVVINGLCDTSIQPLKDGLGLDLSD